MKLSTAIVLPQILLLGAVWSQSSLAQAPATPQGTKNFEKAFQQTEPTTAAANFDEVVDRAINRERILVSKLKEKEQMDSLVSSLSDPRQQPSSGAPFQRWSEICDTRRRSSASSTSKKAVM